jgi:hypothetical protein
MSGALIRRVVRAVFAVGTIATAAVSHSQGLQPPNSTTEQSRPAPSPIPAASTSTATRIVAVEWRIKQGQESEFLDYVSTRTTIPDRSGQVADFMNRVESREQYP